MKYEKGFTNDDYIGWSQKFRIDDNGDKTLRVDYDLGPDSLVVDVGGYLGEWARDIHCKYNCWVDVYEPYPGFCDEIHRKFSHNEKVNLKRYALGATTSKIEFVNNNDATSQFKGGSEEAERHVADVVDVVPELNRHARIDLIKINIEGMEYALLDRMLQSEELMSKVVNIQVQFHMFVKNYEAAREELRERLCKTHQCTYDYPFIWENWTLKK